MDNKKIHQMLKEGGLTEIESLPYGEEALVLKFFYDFDEAELEAARAYANDESDDEEDGEVWHEEFFKPYLSDLAVDNVGEVIEEIMEKLDVDAQYMSYEIDDENYDYNEFIAIFYEKGKDIDIENVLDDIEI